MKYLEVGREKVKSAVLKSKTKPLIGTFRVALVGAGQLFGEQDVIKELEGDKRVYTSSVKCISPDSYVFCMKYEQFLSWFKNKTGIWNMICKQAAEKQSKMHRRYVNIIFQLKEMLK